MTFYMSYLDDWMDYLTKYYSPGYKKSFRLKNNVTQRTSYSRSIVVFQVRKLINKSLFLDLQYIRYCMRRQQNVTNMVIFNGPWKPHLMHAWHRLDFCASLWKFDILPLVKHTSLFAFSFNYCFMEDVIKVQVDDLK